MTERLLDDDLGARSQTPCREDLGPPWRTKDRGHFQIERWRRRCRSSSLDGLVGVGVCEIPCHGHDRRAANRSNTASSMVIPAAAMPDGRVRASAQSPVVGDPYHGDLQQTLLSSGYKDFRVINLARFPVIPNDQHPGVTCRTCPQG